MRGHDEAQRQSGSDLLGETVDNNARFRSERGERRLIVEETVDIVFNDQKVEFPNRLDSS